MKKNNNKKVPKKGKKFVKEVRGEEKYTSKEDGDTKEYRFRNHPSDFIPNELIRKQVGSFSYNNTIGVPINFRTVVNGGVTDATYQVPSVMSIELFSSIGAIEGVSTNVDGLNTSGKKYYNILSSINAKTTNYQPEDISLVELLIADLMGHVANAMRIYGVVFNFNPRNRTVPDALVKAMGIAPASFDMIGDVAAYRMRLNRILTVANQIKFVKDINIFKRSWELFSRIFIDENSSMGQYYVFRPVGYWAYDETGDGTRANWVQFNDLMSADDYLNIIEIMVNNLLDSSLFNYIYTDILNYQLKKGGETLSFSYVPELVQVFGVYDPGILNQIHNMSWGGFTLTDYKIKEDVDHNRIYSTNPLSFGNLNNGLALSGTQLIDQIYTDQPTYDDNVDAVAFKSSIDRIVSIGSTGRYTAEKICLPDHPVYGITIYTVDSSYKLSSSGMDVSVYSGATMNDVFKLLLPFKVWPLLYAVDRTTNAKLNPIGNLNFFSIIEQKQLENMFDYYYLGLYDVEVKDVKEFQ